MRLIVAADDSTAGNIRVNGVLFPLLRERVRAEQCRTVREPAAYKIQDSSMFDTVFFANRFYCLRYGYAQRHNDYIPVVWG